MCVREVGEERFVNVQIFLHLPFKNTITFQHCGLFCDCEIQEILARVTYFDLFPSGKIF